MHFGSPWAAGFGRVDNHIHSFTVEKSSDTSCLKVNFRPTDGLGDAFYGIYISGRRARGLFAAEGDQIINVYTQREEGVQDIQILREGHSADQDLSRVARALEIPTIDKVTLSWAWPIDFMESTVPGSFLSNWDIGPFNPEDMGAWDRPTRRVVDYSLEVLAGVATVYVSLNGAYAAIGSGAVGTTVSLSGADLSGVVDVDALATDESGQLIYRYPLAIQVYRDAVRKAVVYFDGADTIRWVEAEGLAPGSYDYYLRVLSDTGVLGDPGDTEVVNIPGPPLPAENLHYVSGGAADFVVGWDESLTAGATYNIYVQAPDDLYMNLAEPVALPTGTDSYALPAITSNPGITRVLLRAVNGGVEERFGQYLELETDALGVYIPPRPNTPSLGVVLVSGLDGTASVGYSSAFEEAAPSHAQVFLRAETGSYDFGVPAGEATLPVTGYKERFTRVDFTAVAEGFYYITAKARTSAGVQSLDAALERKIYVSDEEEDAPEFEVSLSRS